MRVSVSPDQIRSAFEAVKEDPSFDESRGLWERGRPPVEMIQAMCLRPEILRAFAGFGGAVYPGGLLERRVKELVIITASRSNACQFCTESHCDLVDLAGILTDPLALIDDPGPLAIRALSPKVSRMPCGHSAEPRASIAATASRLPSAISTGTLART